MAINSCEQNEVPLEDLPVINLTAEELKSQAYAVNGNAIQLKELRTSSFDTPPRFSRLPLSDQIRVLEQRLEKSSARYTILSKGHFSAQELSEHISINDDVGATARAYFGRLLDWMILSAMTPAGQATPSGKPWGSERNKQTQRLTARSAAPGKVISIDIHTMAHGAETPAPTYIIKSYADPIYTGRATPRLAVHEMATWSNINSLITSLSPQLIRGSGHGEAGCFFGYDSLGADSEVLLKAGDPKLKDWVEGRIVHLLACETAQTLGVDIVDPAIGNAKAYFGYCERIMLKAEHGAMIAGLDHVVEQSLSLGMTVKEAETEFYDTIDPQIAKYAASPLASDRDILTDLERLRSSFARHGNDPDATL